MHALNEFMGAILILAVAAGVWGWTYVRSRSILNRWAKDNRFEIIESEYRLWRRGPFFWTTTKSQTVFFVKVRQPDGNVRAGWVRCGSWWLGLISEKAAVEWES